MDFDPSGARTRMSRLRSGPLRSILILQTKQIGDLVLSSALARNLQLEYPGVRIVFLCDGRFASFLTANDVASEVVTFRRSHMRGTPLRRAQELILTLLRLRRSHFDMVVDITDTRTSRFISGLIGAPVRVGYHPSERPLSRLERQPANVKAKPFGYGGQHFLYRYLSPLEALGIELRVRDPDIRPLPLETTKALALLDKFHLRPNAFIAVHVGASFPGRRWQPERFAAAIDRISVETGLDVALVGSPDENELVKKVLAAAKARIVNLVGVLPLETLPALFKQARLFLGNDSGPMHMAAAVGTPVVGLFGLQSPVHWGPVGVPSIAVRPAMPCDCVGGDLCERPDPNKACCVWRLEAATVVDAVLQLLARTGMAPEAVV
ncbi:glycosyltransferase family 9 protein [Mesorhizobium sp. CA14]|uniref:glycosyltransferase family 9 protein n=1 Tax=Mesorhizobium sp. CA14 TaxID=2876642 RepID=UPI001CCAF969|nr:glycosyltransferase family 9 protein [Mesorhizobium sp. CA14]MBZ9849635.1 glycosyltransferase family 9 protein [Mesorhizobium sp. CA14]